MTHGAEAVNRKVNSTQLATEQGRLLALLTESKIRKTERRSYEKGSND
jgi:hypothetical protein